MFLDFHSPFPHSNTSVRDSWTAAALSGEGLERTEGSVGEGIPVMWSSQVHTCAGEKAMVAKVAFRFPSHHRQSSCLLPDNS